jgi:cell surface protein SprA
LERYKNYGVEEIVDITNANRGSTTVPDVEDINRDNTMNTINAYYEYSIDVAKSYYWAELYNRY